MIAEPFPFLSHFTLAEVAEIEAARKRFSDDEVMHLIHPENVERVAAFLARNPRPQAGTA